ncbi:MAG TPA: hypothetical protein PK966_09305 [Syntrophorhabdaceae bacterium]|nr:hypothetical protein [Syntrophorhabdaceae bacterium]
MNIFFAVFLTCAILFQPGDVFSWSAISRVSETHQYILKKAYELLLNDPAFKERKI